MGRSGLNGSIDKRTLAVDSPEEMLVLGKRLGLIVPAGAVVSLEGGLGAGKTFFVKGVIGGLGVSEEVLSPTFILVEEYRGDLPVFHFDLYRLEDVDEVEQTGLFDAVNGRNVVLVEWGDRLPDGLIDFDLRINIVITGERSREVTVEGPESILEGLLGEI
ncbi:MAG: tRNA (adenosine(37)-N6)-threonylcarbamoyltransferase complex ATPase subunit type 1 TsaE [Candidatus Krumholzibacteriota bacterium]|nr:tRNA (adenosine(37)-N6)-threonylcarbamoyltransferase complex ATPase subunit type 1 TsaE [Candidatus Krumholzibacteriota bacterium]